jgi:hypothetical protein
MFEAFTRPQRMFSRHQRLPPAKTEHDRTLLHRDIDAVDA